MTFIPCETCGKKVEGWRKKEPGPFKFCCDECKADWLGNLWSMSESDKEIRDFLTKNITAIITEKFEGTKL